MIDLYGGSVEIFFTGKDGVARNVSNIAFPNAGKNGGGPQLPSFVESVTVKTSIIKFTEVEIVFAPPFEQAVNMINSGLMGLGFSGKFPGLTGASLANSPSSAGNSFSFNTVTVKLHYGGKESVYYKSILLAPEISISGENISIKCKGIGMLFPSTKTSEKQVFEKTTREEIINKLSSAVKDKATLRINPRDSKCLEAMKKIEDHNQTETDWREIKNILTKANCVIVDKGMPGPNGKPLLEIISKDFMRKQKKNVITLVVRDQINPTKGIYPILEMDTVLNNYILGQSLGIQKTIFDSSTKEASSPEKSKAGSDTTKDFTDAIPTGDGSMSGGATDPELKKKTPTVSVTKSLEDSVKGLLQEFTDAPLQYKIKTVGIMNLQPGRPIRIKVPNVKFLSNDYDLYEVEHSFSRSGIETSLTLARTFGVASTAASSIEALKAKGVNLAEGNSVSSTPLPGQ